MGNNGANRFDQENSIKFITRMYKNNTRNEPSILQKYGSSQKLCLIWNCWFFKEGCILELLKN
ncbi:hypothetical protein LEP1GSC116_1105 [Leptospira interrogans serovar Icterohaemorrhagiae str. Verdun HP]|uniref:Uncharacterized protein n=3 Tax=Leptospira interrogans TaxID=173 RepID=M6RP23_LEPIR|nr:hypothetical protein AMR47_07135 [Leptospira interrogans]EMO07516.1 hypothetical protein LEP1GSC116_1105 [Leptospira interrogans serovar Icterohaemorrhagiae str. Verdun HP]